jgi:hypothetical protein
MMATQEKPQAKAIPFDDMAEDIPGGEASIEQVQAASRATKAQYEALDRRATGREEKLFSEPCSKCGGSGRYNAPSSLGHHICLKCNGKGVLLFKRPKAERVAAKLKAQERQQRKQQQNLEAVEAEYPALKEWWTGSDFGFAIDLRERATKFGNLTKPQVDAAMRCIEKYKAVQQEREEKKKVEEARVAALPTLDVSHITTAFDKARNAGIKRPKLKLFSGAETFEFSRAPDTGKNPGAVYVNHDGQYMGKVFGGKFLKGYNCSPEIETEVIKTCTDPEQAAIAYGKKFGSCAICSRELSDPVSIERGIGPICYGRFFG